MKTSNILIFGILTIIGGAIFYYFKKNDLQVVDNVQIDKKISEAVKEIISTNKEMEAKKVEDEVIKTKQAIETSSKEAEEYLAKTLLLDKLNKLKEIYRLRNSKAASLEIQKLKESIGYSTKLPLLTQIRDAQNLLKDKYGIYPDSKGNYSL